MKLGLSRAVLLASMAACACGILPERVSQNDPRLRPMLTAMASVDRTAMGFTPLSEHDSIRVEWGPGHGYDVMLHIDGKTSRTIAFRKTGSGYEWIGEQQTFAGPRRYRSVDGELNEQITITYEKVHLSGAPLNTIDVLYSGEDPDLAWPQQLSLERVRPYLRRWGYY